MRYSDLLRYYSDDYRPPEMQYNVPEEPSYTSKKSESKHYDEIAGDSSNPDNTENPDNYVSASSENKEKFIPFQKREEKHQELTYSPNTIQAKAGMTRAEFVKKNYNTFKERYEAAGLDPMVAMAQAILESGFTRYGGEGSGSSLALKHKNLFGIKARKGEQRINMATKEDRGNGKQDEMADFTVNQSFDDSITHHINFLKKYDRYAGLFNNNNQEDIINKLQASGYATDKNYGNLIRTIINKDILPNLKK